MMKKVQVISPKFMIKTKNKINVDFIFMKSMHSGFTLMTEIEF